ncbi:LysE family translocator [Ktedonosporobacter rubrisoli]|uniref:LysE family translocator n=1 Tax=Ktedonosporobacter rubrisoli TaxID=2509675 RepID=A0A4P6JMR2_KTERU|nr:LysE family translocator [Ktedonosporobacter rubrisoli]QBD76534.1 LysE family translocator [Ktedonosporobacter rubrisoli]
MFDTQFGLFVIATMAAIVMPGPDIFYVLARSMSQGRRAGLFSTLGIVLGETIHTLLTVLGLAGILAASLPAFLVIKYVGAVYLIYLGIQTIRHRDKFLATKELKSVSSDKRLIVQGMLNDLLNPKTILFYFAFIPQFVRPSIGHVHEQLLGLGLTLAVMDLLFLSCLALFAGSISLWLQRLPQVSKWLAWISGCVLIGLGVRLAVSER